MTRGQYVVAGVGVIGATLLFAPFWREMHHTEIRGQSTFGFLLQNTVKHEHAQHIAASQAILNAKARYMIGTLR